MALIERNTLIKDPEELQREYRKLTRREQYPSASLVRHHNLLGRPQQIFYHASASLALGDSAAITPPSAMKPGDLVYVLSAVGSGSLRTLTISPTGGQTWNTTKVRDGSVSGSRSVWVSWCTFTGTWSTNPTFAISGSTLSKGYSMHVFRAPKINAVWAEDQAPSHGSASVSGTTYTIAGITNTVSRNVSIFALDMASTTTWVSTSGAGWFRLGSGQYQMSSGANPFTYMFAYQIQGYRIPLGATGDCLIDTSSGAGATNTKISLYFT